MGFFLVLKAELVRNWIIMRRYWFQTLIGMFISYGALMVLIYGFIYSQDTLQDVMSNRLGDADRATNFVLGFIIGTFAFGVIGMYTRGIQNMASTGVLEQLCLSPHGLIINFLARTLVAAISGILSSSFMVWVVTRTVGGTLYFDAFPVVALLALAFVNLLGFGFMVGGLVLVFKQVGQVAVLVRFGLFGIAIFASEAVLERSNAFLAAILHMLPITDAAVCLKYVLIKGQGAVDGNFVSVFTHSSFYFLLISCVAWTTIGFSCFKAMENWSRSKGTLGSY